VKKVRIVRYVIENLGLNIPYLVRTHIEALALDSETPLELKGKILDLVDDLREVAYTIEDMYRKNWHSIHCECDECMKLTYGDFIKEEVMAETYEKSCYTCANLRLGWGKDGDVDCYVCERDGTRKFILSRDSCDEDEAIEKLKSLGHDCKYYKPMKEMYIC